MCGGGAIGASLLIASCCFDPTLVALGVSIAGLAHLASLEPYHLAKADEILGIRVLDHVVFTTDGDSYSYAESATELLR